MKNLSEKPEYKTSLYGSRMVSKTHGRIVFRGALDTMEAEVLEAQILAAEMGENWYCQCLGEILVCLRNIMGCEVNNIPLPPVWLFGFSAEELRLKSQDVKNSFNMKEHPLPEYTLGKLAIRLNYLRARVRELEILAVRVFRSRIDIITALNRLSSAFWWLFCRYAADRVRS